MPDCVWRGVLSARSDDTAGGSIPTTGWTVRNPVGWSCNQMSNTRGCRHEFACRRSCEKFAVVQHDLSNKLSNVDYKNINRHCLIYRNCLILFSADQTKFPRRQRSLNPRRHSIFSWPLDVCLAGVCEDLTNFDPYICDLKFRRKCKALQYKIASRVFRLRCVILFGRIFIGLSGFRTTKRPTI